MVLEKLSTSLRETLRKIARSVFVDEKLINEIVKDIQRSLLQADVNVETVFNLTKEIKQRALEEREIKGINQRERIVNIVYEELVKFLGSEKSEIKIGKKKPFKIMMVGLYGSGKTTTIGKLGKWFGKRGYKVALIGLDVHRPAAIDQIEQIGNQINVKVFSNRNEKNPVKIFKEFEDQYKKYDILLIDTAGRDALSKELIQELEGLNKKIKPDENLLVISGDIGQAARKQAEQFHKSCGVTGIIATKLDGTSKAGGALSACAVTDAHIKFIGVGEKLDDIEEFNPKGFVSRLLGMGDLEALLEKAKGAMSEEKAEDLGKKFLKGDFNFVDLYEQMEAMSKMGTLGKLMEMVPGLGQLKMPKELLEVQEGKFILDSMTKEELEDPELLDVSRLDRIAKGAGCAVKDVRELLKQYRQSKKIMKMMGGSGDPNKLMKKFGSKMKGFKL